MSFIENKKTYTITNAGSTSAKRRLNLYSTGTAGDAMNVVLYTPDNTKEQQWLFQDSRLYTATNPLYCLDRYNLATSASHNNADVYKASAKEDVNQKLEVVLYKDDMYKIKLLGQSLYLTASSDQNGTKNGKNTAAAGNVFWSKPIERSLQLWTFEEVATTVERSQATAFPSESFYTAANNSLYPSYVGECTWYCLGRAHEAKGTKGLPVRNAKLWYDLAKKSGFSVTSATANPVAKSIAVWTKGSYGHVAFVEDVVGDIVYFSEANWYSTGDSRLSNGEINPPPTGTDAQIKTASIAQFKARYAPFAGCIILP